MKRVQLSSLPKHFEKISSSPTLNNSNLLLSVEQLAFKQQGTEIHEIMQKVGEGLLSLPKNLENDSRAKWIFHPDHSDVHNEYALTAVIDDEIVHVIIDRTFVDTNNCRWIIDYKVTAEIIIDDYRAQLENYAKVLRLQESREIKLGLYSPVSKAWAEWRYEG